jgi:hypothetical protein
LRRERIHFYGKRQGMRGQGRQAGIVYLRCNRSILDRILRRI